MARLRFKVFTAIAAGVLLLAGAGFVMLWWSGRGKVGYLFDIKSVPWSVTSVHCESVFGSDTVLTCAFRIDADDLPSLMTDESFHETPTKYGRVHDFPMSHGLGDNFKPVFHYEAIPKDADPGGRIDVFADRSRTKVLAHLHIE